jgi:hypothetical protein
MKSTQHTCVPVHVVPPHATPVATAASLPLPLAVVQRPLTQICPGGQACVASHLKLVAP